MPSRTLIIIPTYNEADNVCPLIDKIMAQANQGHCFDILVVDDSSPDGTSEKIIRHNLLNNKLFLITRKEKNGRGGAVLEGFRFALKQGRYDNVVEMDSDFSHDPKELPQLIQAITHSDVAVGSRYLSKSKIVGWSLKRKIFSRLANFYARSILKIPLTDYTNGFRCYKISELSKLDTSRIHARGYIVLSEIAYQLHLRGSRFSEIPTLFVNRKRGESNLTLKEIREAFLAIPRLYYSYHQERKVFRKDRAL